MRKKSLTGKLDSFYLNDFKLYHFQALRYNQRKKKMTTEIQR